MKPVVDSCVTGTRYIHGTGQGETSFPDSIQQNIDIKEKIGMDRRDLLTLGLVDPDDVVRGEDRAGVTARPRDASQNPPVYARRSATDLTAYSGEWTWREAAHLLRRAMVGPTEAEINQAVADGMAGTMAKLISSFAPSLSGIDDWADDEDFQIRPDTAQGEDFTAYQAERRRRRDALVQWILRINATSNVSMQERLRLFWHNHFTSEILVVNFPELALEQYRLFAAHHLGNFKQMTYDVSIDLAMLIYLDGIRNNKIGNTDNINENYSRELMELFTMGVFNSQGEENYSQDDVIAGARALSGWTYDIDLAEFRTAVYVPRNAQFLPYFWDSGEKNLMGRIGVWNTQDVIDIIFEERADEIAHFICEKIYRGFVFDVPDPVVVDQMASTFLSSNWELKPVFEQLLMSEHFYDETNIGAMHKSPIDYVVGMVRTLGLTDVPGVDNVADERIARDMVNRLTSMGQVPYYPPNVKGWPGGRTWTSTSTLPLRVKFSLDVGNGTLTIRGGTIYTFDPIAFARTFSDPDDIHVLSDEMARYLLNTEPSEQESTVLYETLLDGGKDYEWSLEDPDQKADERIRKFVQAAVQLAKYQLY